MSVATLPKTHVLTEGKTEETPTVYLAFQANVNRVDQPFGTSRVFVQDVALDTYRTFASSGLESSLAITGSDLRMLRQTNPQLYQTITRSKSTSLLRTMYGNPAPFIASEFLPYQFTLGKTAQSDVVHRSAVTLLPRSAINMLKSMPDARDTLKGVGIEYVLFEKSPGNQGNAYTPVIPKGQPFVYFADTVRGIVASKSIRDIYLDSLHGAMNANEFADELVEIVTRKGAIASAILPLEEMARPGSARRFQDMILALQDKVAENKIRVKGFDAATKTELDTHFKRRLPLVDLELPIVNYEKNGISERLRDAIKPPSELTTYQRKLVCVLAGQDYIDAAQVLVQPEGVVDAERMQQLSVLSQQASAQLLVDEYDHLLRCLVSKKPVTTGPFTCPKVRMRASALHRALS
jgi:hypothetical protein